MTLYYYLLITLLFASIPLAQCDDSEETNVSTNPRIIIHLNAKTPADSYIHFTDQPSQANKIPVGLGRNGVTKPGGIFEPGYSLLGEFRVNAVLSADRFEMEPQLIKRSGKTADWLRSTLFQNMSSIDFDNNGKAGEYGEGFIGLVPADPKLAAKQPFRFNHYKNTFRWYSYAIHGTQDQARIGQCITGGCVNVGRTDLPNLLKKVNLGDLVEVRELTPVE